MTYKNLTHFTEDNSLVKSGLLFYDSEGEEHKDSKGNSWNVDKDQIKEIVENTNKHLQLTDIPVFTEHNKTIDAQVGCIASGLEAREISDEDVTNNPKLQPLLGKLGIFCDSIEIKDDNLINKLNKGIGKGISIGIDFAKNVIRELSFVGLPALAGATVFKSDKNMTTNFNTGITLSEVLENKQALTENREEAHDLLDSLFDVINNINALSDEELQGQDRSAFYENAIQEYSSFLPEYLPMMPALDGHGSYTQPDMAAQGYQGQQAQTNTIAQPGLHSGMQKQFSLNLRDRKKLAEFQFGFLNQPRKKEKKKGSLIGGALKTGATLGAGAGLLAAGQRYAPRVKQSLGSLPKDASALTKVKRGAKVVGKGLKKDVGELAGKAGKWLTKKFTKAG